MFGMFGIGMFSLPSAADIKRKQEHVARMAAAAVPWSEARFGEWVGVSGLSFLRDVVKPYLWPGVEPIAPHASIDECEPSQCVDFGDWRYAIRCLPDRGQLTVLQGARRGRVVFAGECAVPGIWRKQGRTYGDTPIMSLTPNEVWTLTPGVRAAKGHTVIAGLGMGWQLVQISHKRSVKRITLVERDADLLGEVYPRLRPLLGHAEVEVLVDDATKLVPTLEADVAVVDIADSYGNNTFPRCPHIGRVWVWGAACLGSGW